MSKNGLLFDYKYCTGCHSCEVACIKELGLDEGQFGIQVFQMGPWKAGKGGADKWVYNYIPAPTDLCNLCEQRVSEGKLPTCVHHCQSMCIEYGPVEDLVKKTVGDYKVSVYSPMK